MAGWLHLWWVSSCLIDSFFVVGLEGVTGHVHVSLVSCRVSEVVRVTFSEDLAVCSESALWNLVRFFFARNHIDLEFVGS